MRIIKGRYAPKPKPTAVTLRKGRVSLKNESLLRAPTKVAQTEWDEWDESDRIKPNQAHSNPIKPNQTQSSQINEPPPI
jgi:hypothetical protein